MIFKAGVFFLVLGIISPFYDGAHFIWWSAREKEALEQYWINRAEGKPLTDAMISSRNDYYVIKLSVFLIIVGFLLFSIGFIWEI